MRRLLPLVSVPLLISACSGGSAPSQEEISKALSERVHGKGCASSVLFKQFPIPATTASSNTHITKPFQDIGFISETDGSYALTEKGKAAYDVEHSGFCYTDSYTISDVKVTGEESGNELPQALSGAWTVSFQIAPSNVDDWVKNPEIINAASLASLEKITQPKRYTVRVARKKGEDALFVADPTFSFTPGIHFNMGF